MKAINTTNYRTAGMPARIRLRLYFNLLSLLIVLIVAVVSRIAGHL